MPGATPHDEWILHEVPRAPRRKVHSWDINGELSIHRAARSNNLRAIERLLASSSDAVAAKNASRCTALHIAAEHGHTDIVTRLLEVGGSLTLLMLDSDGLAAAHYAISGGHGDCLRVLLQADPNPLARVDRDGDGLLSHAVRFGATACVRLLLERFGSDPCEVNREGRTPLHCAAKRGLVEIVQILLDAGADPTAVDGKGDTPLSDAVSMCDSREDDMAAMTSTETINFVEVAALLRTATNASCALQTTKQLLYVPLTPSASNVNQSGARQPVHTRRQTPTTRARGLLSVAYAPGAEALDCSICLLPVMLRPARNEEAERDQAALTACGHLYHLSCWQQMIAFSGDRGVACPNCRDGLTLKHAMPLSPPALAPSPHIASTTARSSGILSPGRPLSKTINDLRGEIHSMVRQQQDGQTSSRTGRATRAAAATATATLADAATATLADAASATLADAASSTSSATLATTAATADENAPPNVPEETTSHAARVRRSSRRCSCSCSSVTASSVVSYDVADRAASSSVPSSGSIGNAGPRSGRDVDLASLSRRELQSMAKALGVPANLKTSELLQILS